VPTFGRQASGHFLRRLIVQVQKAHRRHAAAVRALWATSAAVAALTIFLAADAASGWAEGRRLAVYLVIAAASGTAVVGLALAAWMRIPSPLYVARRIERRRPELKNALITFVELESDPAEDPSVAAAVGRQAARVLSGADPTEFLPSRGIRTPAMAATAAVGLLAGVLWMGQGVLFRPWVSAAQAGPLAGEQATSPTTLAALTKPQTPIHPVASAGSGQAASAENRSDETLGAAIQADREKLERLAEALAATAAGPGSSAASAGSGQAGSAAQSAASAAAGGVGQGTTPAPNAGPKSEAGNTPDSAGAAQGVSGQRGGAGRGQASGPAGGQVTGGVSGGVPRPVLSGRASDVNALSTAGQDPPWHMGEATLNTYRPAAGGGQGPVPQAGIADQGAGGNSAGTGRSEAPGAMIGTGGSGGGTSASRRGVTDGPPLVQRPQTADFPRNALDAMRQVRRLIEEADGRIRDGEVNDAFLGRMGMSNAEFHRFVAAWQRTLETAAPEADAPAGVSGVVGPDATARGELIRPAMGSEARPVLGAAAFDKGDLVQGGDSCVSPRLRPAVAAYFEAVGRLAAEKPVKVGEMK
jgi:hypothetical protein